MLKLIVKLFGKDFLNKVISTRSNVVKPIKLDRASPYKLYSDSAFNDPKLRQQIEDNKLDQDEKREQGAKEVQCSAITRSGKRCSNMALPGQNFCTIHMPVPQQLKLVRCSHIKSNGKRCKMETKNKSGKCYYHD